MLDTHTHTHTLQKHISQQATTNDYKLHTHINTWSSKRHTILLTSALGTLACAVQASNVCPVEHNHQGQHPQIQIHNTPHSNNQAPINVNPHQHTTNSNVQPLRTPHQKDACHKTTQKKIKQDHTTHIENTHSLYSHDFCHSAASSIKSSVWLCMFSQPNLQPTKLYHPSEQEAAVHAP